MKTKKVNRYYCDFCGKGGCSAGHMKKHESRCTNNPNRECGMCLIDDEYTGEARQKPMAELVAIMPDKAIIGTPEYLNEETNVLVESAMASLREATEECPACMLAALRQSGWSGHVDFNFKKEMEFAMEQFQEERRGSY